MTISGQSGQELSNGSDVQPSARARIPAAVVAGIAYLAFRVTGYSTTIPARVVGSVLLVAFCVSGALAAVVRFSRWGDRSTRTLILRRMF